MAFSNDLECPRCGQEVELFPACPTYKMGEYPDGRPRMMACWPACGNANEWRCPNHNCDWYYIDGLSPESYRFESNEANKPEWID